MATININRKHTDPLRIGQRVRLSCGHPRIIAFNDSLEPTALQWCDRCDGCRALRTAHAPDEAEVVRRIARTIDGRVITRGETGLTVALEGGVRFRILVEEIGV